MSKKRLSQIANCFAESLEIIKFHQCTLPIKQEKWRYFAIKCQCLKSIFCEKTCSSINTIYHENYEEDGAYWLKCKRNIDNIDNLLNIALKQAFKCKTTPNINIIIKKTPITSCHQYDDVIYFEWNDELFADWKSPTKYEECKLCESNVSIDFMNDHLDNICINKLIQCNLCKMDNIKRCQLVNHWNNDCNQYEYICIDCFAVFKNRNKYYQHSILHRKWNDDEKRMFHFGNIHSDKHRNQFCDDKSIELAWKCIKCQRRCMGSKVMHQCPNECINWSYNNMYNICDLCDSSVPIGKMKDHLENICVNQTIKCNLCNQQMIRENKVKHWNKNQCIGYIKADKRLSRMIGITSEPYRMHLITYWIRNEIQNKYKLYSRIPIEIFQLISTFYARKKIHHHHDSPIQDNKVETIESNYSVTYDESCDTYTYHIEF